MNISSTHNLAAPADVPAQPSSATRPSQATSTLIRAVQTLNYYDMFGEENELTFAIDRAAREVVIRLVNRNTHELVEQIPDQAVLRLAEELNANPSK